jgi:hypothetical protein
MSRIYYIILKAYREAIATIELYIYLLPKTTADFIPLPSGIPPLLFLAGLHLSFRCSYYPFKSIS